MIHRSYLQFELLVIHKACMIITQHRNSHNIVEFDCKIVVQLLQYDTAPLGDAIVVIEDMKFMAFVSSISFSSVPRSCNGVAH